MADDKIRIQWFPGHMTKAKREMQEKLNMVDMVIELRDARIPSASKNPMIEELCQNKPRLIVLSKKDKADAAATKLWCSALQPSAHAGENRAYEAKRHPSACHPRNGSRRTECR